MLAGNVQQQSLCQPYIPLFKSEKFFNLPLRMRGVVVVSSVCHPPTLQADVLANITKGINLKYAIIKNSGLLTLGWVILFS